MELTWKIRFNRFGARVAHRVTARLETIPEEEREYEDDGREQVGEEHVEDAMAGEDDEDHWKDLEGWKDERGREDIGEWKVGEDSKCSEQEEEGQDVLKRFPVDADVSQTRKQCCTDGGEGKGDEQEVESRRNGFVDNRRTWRITTGTIDYSTGLSMTTKLGSRTVRGPKFQSTHTLECGRAESVGRLNSIAALYAVVSSESDGSSKFVARLKSISATNAVGSSESIGSCQSSKPISTDLHTPVSQQAHPEAARSDCSTASPMASSRCLFRCSKPSRLASSKFLHPKANASLMASTERMFWETKPPRSEPGTRPRRL